MKKHIHKLVFFVAWMFLIYITHSIVYNAVSFCIPNLPYWLSDLTFFIIAGIYVYILVRYSIRIEITIEGKQVFYFRNRGNK